MKKTTSEFDNFDRTMQVLIKVPHNAIKAKLDAEKAEKAAKPKKPKLEKRKES
jgi:hypothetical protein